MAKWILPPSGMFNLRSATDVAFLKLSRREPSVQNFLIGLYKEAAKWEGKLPKGWTDESVKKFWDTMTGDVKHKVTKCIKEMEGKGVDPGAFCASLADKVEGTAWRHEPRRAATVDPTLKRAIDEFVKHAQKTINDHWKKQGFTFSGPPNLSIMWGQRYARIVRTDEDGSSRSVFGFVDLTNGDLLKAATWRAPAKHARGNVLDKSTWQGSHSPWGMAYLRSAARVASRHMKKAGQVAQTIADQMGGVRRLKMFLGADVFALPGDKGLGIKFPNKKRSKGNYVEIIYNRGSDLYDVTFFDVSVRGKKPVRKETGVYADMLVDMFERQTGWYLRLASQVVARYLKARKEVYVDVRELPAPIQKALKAVKYGRPSIMVEESRTYQMSSLSGEGRRGFTVAVNLGTGRYQVEWGSWGGPNMFNPDNPVDLDTKSRPIPPNNVIISGVVGGGKPTYASIKAHPDNLTKLLGAGDDIQLTPEQQKALYVIAHRKSGYRAEAFARGGIGLYGPDNHYVKELAQMGLVKIMGNGIKVTTKGMNVELPQELSYRLAARYLQSKYIVVTPAYGRDYRSKKEAIADWEAGKDFILQDITSRWDGKPINKEDAKRAGFSEVNIRFKRNTQVAVVKLASDRTALKVEPIPVYEAERIQQAIQFHNSEAIDSSQMADDIEKAWDRWDLRTLASYQVLSRTQMKALKEAMRVDSPDEDFLQDIGRTIKEHIQALRTEAWDHRKEAEAIGKAWQRHDMRALKKMRVIKGQKKKAQIDRTVAVLLQAGKAALIHENGDVEEIVPANGKDFRLQELQKVVKGYIEIVPMGRIIMVANEEGLMKRMKPNAKATRMHGGQVIVGPVVVCPSRMVK